MCAVARWARVRAAVTTNSVLTLFFATAQAERSPREHRPAAVAPGRAAVALRSLTAADFSEDQVWRWAFERVHGEDGDVFDASGAGGRRNTPYLVFFSH